MIIQEDLKFAVIGKFSYGWPELEEIRKIVPLQCEIKVECKIGFLKDRHVLIRLTTMEDYVHVMSKLAYFLRAKDGFYQMRPLKWEPWFNPEAETTTALAWISFPGLSPNFFIQESLFTLAKAVGKPLHMDMATKNKSRPSCAKIKVEVYLLRDFPKRINVGVKKAISGEIISKWINIKYDYLPKYCKTCKLQGHTEMECYVLRPELKVLNDEGENNGDSQHQNKGSKILASSKGVGTQTQNKKVKINEETKMMDFQNKGTGRQQRNLNL
ncbi:hypothetical protein R3W88_002605 [Solanum pinnatisectum]|uniref:DUF4283 domain-containing protein n=1 Tax=Solanum pinnatisectum TaxID=50273 RepID=A0AAV9MLP0_9SOLN|nr:hypothetical protein R3W88_002605 [Solanum pinnatisectum]